MGKLKELMEMPKVIVNGKTYVPEKLYKEYLIERLYDVMLECQSQEEKDGITYAMQRIQNS